MNSADIDYDDDFTEFFRKMVLDDTLEAFNLKNLSNLKLFKQYVYTFYLRGASNALKETNRKIDYLNKKE